MKQISEEYETNKFGFLSRKIKPNRFFAIFQKV